MHLELFGGQNHLCKHRIQRKLRHAPAHLCQHPLRRHGPALRRKFMHVDVCVFSCSDRERVQDIESGRLGWVEQHVHFHGMQADVPALRFLSLSRTRSGYTV